MPYEHVLQDDEKRELLRIARATLKEYFASGRVPPGAPHRASMTAPAGVFVALFAPDGSSRGSLGQPGDSLPLYKAIQEMAVASATRDPRVAPVAAEELKELTIQIAVLGPRRAITDVTELVEGKEGLVVTVGPRRGQALPVPGPGKLHDAASIAAEASKKAGLPEDGWKKGASLEAFAVQTFDEQAYPPLSAVVSVKKP
jgi:AmmeMemoRadiSam system protein A